MSGSLVNVYGLRQIAWNAKHKVKAANGSRLMTKGRWIAVGGSAVVIASFAAVVYRLGGTHHPSISVNDLNNGQAWEKVVNADPKDLVSVVYDEYVTKHNGDYFFYDKITVPGHLVWSGLSLVIGACCRHATDSSRWNGQSTRKEMLWSCARITEIVSQLRLPDPAPPGSTPALEPESAMAAFLYMSSGRLEDRINRAIDAGVLPRDPQLTNDLSDLVDASLALMKKIEPSLDPVQRAKNRTQFLGGIPGVRTLVSSVVKDLSG